MVPQREQSILVVDDNELMRMLLKTRLEREGYQVIEAFDGQSAIDMVIAQRPTVVICDLAMPKVSGFDVMKAIRQQMGEKAPPFIVLTANYDSLTRIKSLEMGASEIFPKPIPFEKLLLAVKSLLSQPNEA
jgi:DNA-binding response OmpR family regulator